MTTPRTRVASLAALLAVGNLKARECAATHLLLRERPHAHGHFHTTRHLERLLSTAAELSPSAVLAEVVGFAHASEPTSSMIAVVVETNFPRSALPPISAFQPPGTAGLKQISDKFFSF